MQCGSLRWLWIIFLAGIALGFSQALPARAGAETQIENPRVDYVFGSQITFRADLKPVQTVAEARFYFLRPEDDDKANVVPATIDEQGVLSYEYDSMRFPLRAFSRLVYWFEVVEDDGTLVTGNKWEFAYEDNRFAWQDLQAGPFIVHWYDGDTAYAQELLDVAQKGLLQAQIWLPAATSPDEVNIYAYASAEEMRSTMQLAGTNWIAGHADLDLNLIRVTLPPGPEQRTEMERQIPHELMHILLYQAVGADYDKLPAWLKEGLASVNEIYPNPYYHTILSQAVARDGLLSFSDICQNFPVDASGAYLAYAQAASFTRYLFDQYGAEGMETLVAMYTLNPDLDCQDGTSYSLGTPLGQLEHNWRQTILGEKSAAGSTGSPWPWVTVLGVVLVVPLFILMVSGSRRARRMQTTANPRRSA